MENLQAEIKSKPGFLNLMVFVLSIYVLGALFIDTLYVLPKETHLLLIYIDHAICAVFFMEFCVEYYRAESKLKFMKWGWIDLVSCIPMIEYLRFGRMLRLIRLLRIIRAFRSTKKFIDHVFLNKAQGTLASVFLIALLVIIFSSIAILQVENDPESNIKTAGDAIWWAFETITTVSYGELFPVTTEGRIIAGILMTGGVGLFGTFTAFIAAWFFEEKIEEDEKERMKN